MSDWLRPTNQPKTRPVEQRAASNDTEVDGSSLTRIAFLMEKIANPPKHN